MSSTYLSKVEWDRSERKCPICGAVFKPKSPNHIYCSQKCYKIGHNEKSRIQNAQKKYYSSEISPNMQRIMELVKDNPNYAQIVREMEDGENN